jgi:hypothetical protein
MARYAVEWRCLIKSYVTISVSIKQLWLKITVLFGMSGPFSTRHYAIKL